MEDASDLGNLGQQIPAHWRKYRPRMARELDQGDTLDEAVHSAEALTVSAYQQALRAGLAPDQARELVREEWAFLPDEDDVRHLPPERDARKLATTREMISPARASWGGNLQAVSSCESEVSQRIKISAQAKKTTFPAV